MNHASSHSLDSGNTAPVMLTGRQAAWLKIIAVGMITLVAFEVIAVTTAMPYVVEAMNGMQYYALVSGIPMVTQLITTAIAGPWCDAKDPKHALYAGLAMFISGLVIATFSSSILALIVGRAVQGLGGGLLVVPFYVMVGSYVLPSKQPSFFAAFALAWVLPSLVGPVVAGFFVDYLHWRLVFGIIPILYILFFPVAYRQLSTFPPIHSPKPLKVSKKFLAATLATGICISVIQIMSGVVSSSLSSLYIVGVVGCSLIVFAAAHPLFPRGTFKARRGVPATVTVRAIINGATVTVELYLVLMLKVIHDWSATQAGFVITASALTWAAGSWIQGRIVEPRKRAFLPVIGPVIQLVGTALTLVALIPGVSGWIVLLGWLVAGFGTGLLYPATTVHALALTPPEQHGEVSSALSIADNLGAALLVAYTGIIYGSLHTPMGGFATAISVNCVLIAATIWLGTRMNPRHTPHS